MMVTGKTTDDVIDTLDNSKLADISDTLDAILVKLEEMRVLLAGL